MTFVAIDVETANQDPASICQIGAVWFADGAIRQTWVTLVDPQDFFSRWNVAIHGITPRAVRGAPTWPHLFGDVEGFLRDQVVVCHTFFDRNAVGRASEKHGLPEVRCTWLDSCRLARQAWPEISGGSYGLANVARTLGIEFRHHDALEDARAAGEIVARAVEESGRGLDEWLARTEWRSADRVAREGAAGGPLAGEVLVFTGALSLPRGRAADLAAMAGCSVADSVTTRTTLLVIGEQPLRGSSGDRKTTKHRRAERLIARGQAIRILSEAEFHQLMQANAPQAAPGN